MRAIRWGLGGLLLGLAGLWLWANPDAVAARTLLAVRNELVQITGVLAVGAMAAAMLLATRPRWLTRRLGGLDKGYRLHRWLGLAAGAAGVLHWLAAKGPKWAVQAGWLARPERHRPPGPPPEGIDAVLRSLRGPAEAVGEWAFYAAALLIALALLKRLPYRWFAKTHTVIAVVFVALAFHAGVLLRADNWQQPVGWVVAALLVGGVWAAGLALTRRIGRRHRTPGRVIEVQALPESRSAEVVVEVPAEGWPGHAAGQFAFVTFEAREGAHPYSLASAWDPATRRLRFVIKGLGDYTKALVPTVSAGDAVQVEGPYGGFTFDDAGPQVWIGAGIGVTPFLARLDALARAGGHADVDLVYATRGPAVALDDDLAAAAQAAGVRLHRWDAAARGRLDPAGLHTLLPRAPQASVWFCGPTALGAALRRALVAAGLPVGRFHQELFEMR